ncbi:MAG: SCO2322 family protein [Actinomycetes bacterium]
MRLLAIALAALASLTAFASPAHAAAYRYWSYWSWSNGAWHYSNQGPSGSVHDGDTIGWRFAVQANSSSAYAPRASGTSLCSDGVTVVIDYGSTGDAPPGERPPFSTPRGFCANDADSTNGYRATAEHATVRTNDSGLVCGIDGYPKSECAPIVSASHSPTAHPTSPTRLPHSHARPVHRRAPAPVPVPNATVTARPGARAASAQPSAAATGPVEVLPTPTPTLLVTTSMPGAAKHHSGSSVPVALIAGVVIAAVLGGVAVWRYRAGPR